MRRRRVVLALVVAALALLVLWLSSVVVDRPPEDDASSSPSGASGAAPAGAPSIADGPPAAGATPAEALLPPEEPGVPCTLPAEARDATEAQVRGAPWLGPRRGKVVVQGGVVEVPRPRPDGQGGYKLRRRPEGTPAWKAGDPVALTIDLAGFGRVAARLDTAAWTCAVEPAVARFTAVSGRVLLKDLADGDRVEVVGCGTRSPVDGDGGFFLELPPEPCELRATRRDGAFLVRSEPVRVEPGAEGEVVLDLALPAWRAAGVGTQVAEDPDGIRLQRVFPGTPAEEAGLRNGDVVVALDGEDVGGLDVNAFVDAAVGPPGTEVTYTVLRDGEEVDVTMTREAMASPFER